jgi:STE24 endopeptidase
MSIQPETILTIILAIVAIGYVADQLLDYINLKAQRRDIPDEIATFYDRDKYLRSLDYHRELTNFSFITSAASFAGSFLMLWFGGFGWLDSVLRPFIDSEIFLALAFFGVLMIVSDILTLPFQLYATFVIEEKYGFNKTTVKTFIADKLKGYLLSAIVGGGLLSLLIWLIRMIGPDFWIWFSIIAAVFILFINMFYN